MWTVQKFSTNSSVLVYSWNYFSRPKTFWKMLWSLISLVVSWSRPICVLSIALSSILYWKYSFVIRIAGYHSFKKIAWSAPSVQVANYVNARRLGMELRSICTTIVRSYKRGAIKTTPLFYKYCVIDLGFPLCSRLWHTKLFTVRKNLCFLLSEGIHEKHSS